MKKDLIPIADALKQEEEQRKKRQQKERTLTEAPIANVS